MTSTVSSGSLVELRGECQSQSKSDRSVEFLIIADTIQIVDHCDLDITISFGRTHTFIKKVGKATVWT